MKNTMPEIDENGVAFCPECGYPVGFPAISKTHKASCPNCGQLIDWKEEEKSGIQDH